LNTAIDGREVQMKLAYLFKLNQIPKQKNEWVHFDKFERGKLF
jgi:hypothetical protein